jgi:hypothetical protein
MPRMGLDPDGQEPAHQMIWEEDAHATSPATRSTVLAASNLMEMPI